MSEFVRIWHAETGGESDVPVESLPAWEGRGWEAISEPRSLSRAQDEETVRAHDEAAARADARAEAEQAAGDTKQQILDRVGSDPVLAAEALRVESEKAQPRVTLVAELESIAGRAAGAAGIDTEQEN